MIDMTKDKKENIFNRNFVTLLIIIISAVLIIVGSTYAFLSATFVAGGSNSINGSTYDFNVTLTLNIIKNDDTIPVEDNLITSFLNSASSCVDSQENDVCSIYKLTLTNRGSIQTLNGYMETVNTTYTTNHLKYGIYTKSGNTYTLISDTKNLTTVINARSTFTLNNNNIIFTLNDGTNSNTTGEYYLVFWLSEAGYNQLEDQDKTYSGKVVFKSTSGDTISATFD